MRRTLDQTPFKVSLLYGKSGSIKTKDGPSLQAWNTTPDQRYGANKPACYGAYNAHWKNQLGVSDVSGKRKKKSLFNWRFNRQIFFLKIWNDLWDVCWMGFKQGFIISHPYRQNANIWLNSTALKSIRKVGKVTSLTVSPGVENKLSLQYGGSVQAWTLRVTPGKHVLFLFCLFFTFLPIKSNNY